MQKKFHEEVKRSVTKAVTFRILVLCSDAIIVFAITHRYDITLGVVIFSNFASSILYYLHERLWNKIHWGRSKK